MKKTLAALAGALVLTALPALAGEKQACTASAQECLDNLAWKLENRGWVGIQMEKLEDGRLRVLKVVESSPAERAGLQAGDVLVAAEGLKYGKSSQEEWSELMKGWNPGRRITYKISREGTMLKLRLELGELPPEIRYQMVGAHLMEHARVAQALN